MRDDFMIKFILGMFVLLIIVLVLRKKRPSVKMQFLTHVLLYLIEIITVTTIFNYYMGKYEGVSNNSSLINTLKNYVFGYTVYQLILLVTFKLKDSLDIDAYTSMKNEIDRCQLWAEFKKKVPDEYIEKTSGIVNRKDVVYTKEQRDVLNEKLGMARLYNKEEISVEDFRLYLKQQSMQMDLSAKIIGFGWMNSVLLRWFK